MLSDRMRKMLKESKKYCGERECYIHLEMKNGHCERIVAGHYLPILHGLTGVVDKLAQASGKTPGEIIMDLASYQQTFEMYLAEGSGHEQD